MSALRQSTLVDATEARVQAATTLTVKRLRALQAVVGDRAYGEIKLNTFQKALDLLPSWFVFGNAEDPIAVPWWTDSVKAHGLVETLLMSTLCEALYQDPKYGLLASMGQDIDLHDLFQILQRTQPVLHQGRLRPSWWTVTKRKIGTTSEPRVLSIFRQTFKDREAA